MTNFMINRVKNRKKALTGQLILLLAGIYGFMPSTSYANVQCDVASAGDIRMTPVIIYNTDIPTTWNYLYVRGPRMDCSFTHPQERMGKLIFEIDPSAPSNIAYPEAFDTNLRGVGLKHEITGNPACTLSTPLQIACNIKLIDQRVHFVIRRLFFKTDQQQDFGIINIPQGYIKYYLEEDGPASAKDLPGILDAAQGIVSKNGCTLDTPNLNFDLGKHQQKAFSAVGSFGREITQSIILSCDPKTKYSLTVNGDDAGKSGVIKLTQEPGVASGIGVQLLAGKNKDPVVLGSAKEMGTSAAKGTDLEATIDITARYYQTDAQITPGKANASATFTMTYQ
ncbi:TPA: fimbrial protein [Yersinia enterocolitica]